MSDNVNPRIAVLKARLAELEEEKARLLSEINSLSVTASPVVLLGTPLSSLPLTTSDERIALFIRLFRCRQDVFPKLWENLKKGIKGYSPACQVEWIHGVCDKPRVKCSECPNRIFLPFDETVIREHLEGKITVGTYTIREDHSCIFLAADFDKECWESDISAYKQEAANIGVDVAIERSRSGNGGHAWIFFAEPVASHLARRLGTFILTNAMAQRHHIEFESYDRFFPSQDTLPKGGFGNLIAVPLQRIPRKIGNSVFVDDEFNPYPDQWDFLRRIRLLSAAEIMSALRTHSPSFTPTGQPAIADPLIMEAENSIDTAMEKIRNIFPHEIAFHYSRHLEIVIEGLPSSLISAFRRTAAFANPKFFELQRMRFSTWNTPRYISCAELSDDGRRMFLPRGLLNQCIEIANLAGAKVIISDARKSYSHITVNFTGELLPMQKKALHVLEVNDSGVLVAPPGAGKTVMACALIAKRKLSTLILVHRKQLADQWKEQLLRFTNLTKKQIGVCDGEGLKQKGMVDIGMLQSLSRENLPGRIISEYGQIIIDECHHVPAASFEPVLKRISSRHYLGLTATPYRKDGLEKIIIMQCGPVLHTMTESSGQMQIARRVIVRETSFRIEGESQQLPLHEIWQALATDKERIRLIASDVVAALGEGRFPLVLSDRKGQLDLLLNEILLLGGENHFKGYVLTSSSGKRARKQIIEEVNKMREEGGFPFILSTGSLIGEGFDMPELCTLVLAMPLSFKGRLVQYAGRLHRESAGKTDVRIYDYADVNLALGITMFRKRMTTYRKMGYAMELPPDFAITPT